MTAASDELQSRYAPPIEMHAAGHVTNSGGGESGACSRQPLGAELGTSSAAPPAWLPCPSKGLRCGEPGPLDPHTDDGVGSTLWGLAGGGEQIPWSPSMRTRSRINEEACSGGGGCRATCPARRRGACGDSNNEFGSAASAQASCRASAQASGSSAP